MSSPVNTKLRVSEAIDVLVIWLIGLACYFYAVFNANFAELHVQFPFFNFPVFIGEILLGISLVLLAIKFCLVDISVERWKALCIFGYVIFVIAKALYGYNKYHQWGALALRHAAEFYYPLFALIAYYVYRDSLFGRRLLYFILTGVILAYLNGVYKYSVLPLLLISLICIIKIRRPSWQIIALILVLAVLPYYNIFDQGRTRIFGNAVGLITFFALFINRFMSGRKVLKFALVGLFIGALLFTVVVVADPNAVKSITSLNELPAKWKKHHQTIAQKKETFVFEQEPVRLYNVNATQPVNPDTVSSSKEELAIGATNAAEGNRGILSSNVKLVSKISKLLGPLEQPSTVVQKPDEAVPSNVRQARSLETANNNIIFRLLIWEDILRDIKERKPVLGTDFGFPFRSENLEILGWADDAWKVDGWISVHNSYLNLIYRGGIVGLALVILIFFYAFKIIRCAVIGKSLAGMCITSLVLFWLMVANFTEFLELPYTAIPFWAFFGFTLAYCKNQKKINANLRKMRKGQEYAIAK
jgi:hypothetical protein